MTNRPTLRKGDIGPDVKDLIDLLPTWCFDETVDASVRDYQKSRGLAVDGIVGEMTWAAL